MVYVDHIHRLQQLLMFGFMAQGEVKARIRERQCRAADDAGFVILILRVPKGEDINLVPCIFEGTFIQGDVVGHTAYMWFVGICHHPDTHDSIVQLMETTVKALVYPDLDAFHQDGRIIIRSNFGQINFAQ